MRKESARKLNRMILKQRIRSVALFAVIPMMLTVVGIFYLFDTKMEQTRILQATVSSWSRAQDETGNGSYVIVGKLTDGSKITAFANRHGRSPTNGKTIKIIEYKTGLGRKIYHWRN